MFDLYCVTHVVVVSFRLLQFKDCSLLSVCITYVCYIQSNDRSRAVMNAKRELLIGRYPPRGAGGVSGH